VDPVLNPYAPGAGTPPPELAGRDDLREKVRIAIARLRRGLQAKSVLMVGLRGVGKTVLLDRMRDDARANGVQTIRIEAPEGRSLPALLAPQLRQALLALSRNLRARDLAQRGLRALAGFAKSLKLKYEDIEVGLDFDPEPGLADNGDLEHDLQALLETAGQAAASADTALAMFIDELQHVKEDELAALITAMHRCAQQRLPIVLVGAGLPQLPGRMGRAKSYAERLFDFPEVGPLNATAARLAIIKPAHAQGVDFTEPAVAALSEDAGLPLLSAGVGQTRLGPRDVFADPARRRCRGFGYSHRGIGREFLSRALRPPDAGREALPARHGGIGPGAAPLRRHR